MIKGKLKAAISENTFIIWIFLRHPGSDKKSAGILNETRQIMIKGRQTKNGKLEKIKSLNVDIRIT